MSSLLHKPLHGVRIVEFEGIGPGPLAALMLADLGADVTTLVRPAASVAMGKLAGTPDNPLRRGKRMETVDLKTPAGLARARDLISQAEGLIEGNRPGVMERLGLGPADCAAFNPNLVYGRMTGWGQDGPLAQAAGHDLNYVALTGLLSLASRDGQPPQVPPRWSAMPVAPWAWPSAWSAPCCRSARGGLAGWSMQRLWTLWPCSAPWFNGFALGGKLMGQSPALFMTRRFTTATPVRAAVSSPWGPLNRRFMLCF